MLTALSRGAGTGADFLLPGRLAGGAGGAGLLVVEFRAVLVLVMPLGMKPLVLGTERAVMAGAAKLGGGGGGGAGAAESSTR